MMISVMMVIYLMMFNLLNSFSGLLLCLMLFIILIKGNYLFGLNMIKGDLYGLLGVDYISFLMVLLLMWLGFVVISLFKDFMIGILMLCLLISILFMFISLDFIYLFIYFEFSMIPMFLMIMFMGMYKERYKASLYMFMYTMLSSLPSLLILMIINSWLGGMSLVYMVYDLFSLDGWVKVIIVMMFLVKVPMFMVHIWLPKAHVEAPVFGSMVLASIMLKMGGYGIIRFMDIMELDMFMNDFFFCLCLISMLVLTYFCMYQVDLKVLVAYSSIIHMGLMLLGFFSGSEMGYLGGIIVMCSHGICSSGLFYLVNEIYVVSGSRLLIFNKGISSALPMLSMFWLIMLVNNLGVPPCLGVLGELMLLGSCFMYTFFVFFFFFFYIFFMSCFIMNMYGLLVGGSWLFNMVDVYLVIYYGSIMHLIPLNFVIFLL